MEAWRSVTNDNGATPALLLTDPTLSAAVYDGVMLFNRVVRAVQAEDERKQRERDDARARLNGGGS